MWLAAAAAALAAAVAVFGWRRCHAVPDLGFVASHQQAFTDDGLPMRRYGRG